MIKNFGEVVKVNSWVPKSMLISMLVLGLTACAGYQEGSNGNRTSIEQIGDNRQEYLIKNRTDENDYLDMNTNPNMDTRAMDERKMGTTADTHKSAKKTMEHTIQQRLLKINGVQTAEVTVKDEQISIRFQAKNGANTQELKKQIADTITKLYGLPTVVHETVK